MLAVLCYHSHVIRSSCIPLHNPAVALVHIPQYTACKASGGTRACNSSVSGINTRKIIRQI